MGRPLAARYAARVSAPLPLTQIELTDRHRVGGKALQLARLARRGLPVPAGFAIPVEAFEQALTQAGLGGLAQEAYAHPSESNFAAMREAIGHLELPSHLRRLWVQSASRIAGRLAVRSSGIDEDGARRSFAGQHQTELGVSPSEVPRAVLSCWASLYSPSALAYRRADATGPRPGAMGVVVQELVDSRVSGVMFTVNPLNGSWREMIVESTWGLCEGLVSGRVAPHWSLVRRPRRAPRTVQRVLARVRLSLMQQDLPPIDRRWVVRSGELIEEAVPERLIHQPTLTQRELMRLCRMGLHVEGLLGEPQDLEWSYDATGKLFLLQARPITASAHPRPRADVLWTRRFIGERWPEPATPLGWSLMAPMFEHFIAYPDTQRRYLGGGPALRLVEGRPYLNTTIFRHLGFKLPGAPAPRFMTELVPPDEEAAWQRSFAVLPDLSVYGAVLRETLAERRWERFAFNPVTNHLVWDAFEANLESLLPRLAKPPVSRRDALRKLERQLATIREYVGIHIVSLLFANLSYQLLEGLLALWLPEGAVDLLHQLAVCPPGNQTLATNAALHRLAAQSTDEDLEALATGAEPRPAFRDALEEFLSCYGHRATASWEIFTPRWRDRPDLLVPLLKSARAAGDPSARAERQEAMFTEASASLAARLPAPKRAIVGTLTHYTRRYLLLRENQRFAFDRLLLTVQDTAYWIGDRLVEDGLLSVREDIAFLTWDELHALIYDELDPNEVRDSIQHRAALRTLHTQALPPVFLQGDDGVNTPPTGSRLQGLGISPGRATGIVRVIHHLAEADRLEPGEVLVAPAVDPAWTPLFLKSSAVLLEMGSRLSHGAVVAREYGVPAVVNLDGIVHRLRDGQRVTVDGTRGAVWLHESS